MSNSSHVLKHGRPADAGMDPARIALIRERASQWVADGDMPSLSLLIARKGVVVLEEAFGTRGPPDNDPLKTDDIFPVMSVTKMFTATAIMQLVEDGLLSLKYPVTELIPEITTPGAEQVLIADLLTHTSGYDDAVVMAHVGEQAAAAKSNPPPSLGTEISRLIRFGADAPLSRKPGEAAMYSNFGFELLGDIVARVSGQSLAGYVESRILEPLGMTDTYTTLPRTLRGPRRVFRQPKNLDITQFYPEAKSIDSESHDDNFSGALGLMSTAGDLGRFGQMLLNGGAYEGNRILTRASLRVMTMPQWAPGVSGMYTMADPVSGEMIEYPIRGGNWGFGFYLLTADDRADYINGSLASSSTFGHTGALGCYFWVDPVDEVMGVYLSVVPRPLPSGNQFFWRADRFQDMVHAAVID